MPRIVVRGTECPPTENLPDVTGIVPNIEVSQSIIKQTLDNKHIQNFKTVNIENIPVQTTKFETKTLNDLVLEPNSCARYTITTDIIDPIIHAGFEIISEAGILHNTHLESIVENKINIIVNNLTDDIMKFALNYFSVHRL